MNTNSQSAKKGSSQSSILTFFNLTSSKKPSQVKSSQKSNGLSGKRTFSEMQQTNKNDSDDVIFIKENPAISGKKRKIINDSDDDVEMIAIESTSKTKNSINDLKYVFDYDSLIADCELYQEWFSENEELVFATSICLEGKEVYRYTFCYDSPEDLTVFEFLTNNSHSIDHTFVQDLDRLTTLIQSCLYCCAY